MNTTTASVKGSDVVSLTSSDHTYTVPHYKSKIAATLALLILPLVAAVITLILAAVGVIAWNNYPWWLIGVASGMTGCTYFTIRCTTTQIVFHGHSLEVSHLNIMGRTICVQDHVPLANYEAITVEGNMVSYTKTDKYFAACRARTWFRCCVKQTENYYVTEPEQFIKDHGMTNNAL